MDDNFRKRIRRRLYYGHEDLVNLDRPSLPLTEFTVEYFKESVSQKLGHVDLDIASNLINKNNVSPCSMVLSLLYAKRLRQQNKDYLGSISSSDVFFISMMLASKYMYDEGSEEEVYNDEWAESVDQEVEEVNAMETDFLDALDWSLFVKTDEFEATLTDIERNLALRAGLHRGWFTYSEMAVLLDSGLFTRLWNNVGLDCSKISVVISAYMSCCVSLLGSAALAAQISAPLSSALVSGLSSNLAPIATHLAPMALTGLTLVTSLRPTLPFGLTQWDGSNPLPVQNMSTNLLLPMEPSLPLPDPQKSLSANLPLPPQCPVDYAYCSTGLLSPVKEETASSGFGQTEMIAVGDVDKITNEGGPDSEVKSLGSHDGNVQPPDETSLPVGDDESGDPSHKAGSGRSSMVSLWLVKSLLSQLWSVSASRGSCPSHSSAASQHCSCSNCVRRSNRRKTMNQTSGNEEPEGKGPILRDDLVQDDDRVAVAAQEFSAEDCLTRLSALIEDSGIPFTTLPKLSDLVKSACSADVKCLCKETPLDYRASLSYRPWDYYATEKKPTAQPSFSPSLTVGTVWHPSACVSTAIEVT